MTEIVMTKDNGWLFIKDSNGNKRRYLWYSKRERLKNFKEEFGHKYKRVELYDFTNEVIR